MQVRDRLKQLLDERLGGNQSELARRLGEKPYWVSYRLSGTTQIKADEIPLLAEALGVPPAALYEDAPGAEQTPRTRVTLFLGRVWPDLSEAEAQFLTAQMPILRRYRAEVQTRDTGARSQP
ncbi:MAG TPA: helix-turn-helix transcriptional regulator [Chloroflexota bacterium]|jgi:transcriptional regulator with XRE-family HTH domain